jgi:hypothetical protein
MTAGKLSPSDATALVESYRVKLGLLPWPDHAKACIRINGRGYGKTTRAILEALAATVEHPDKLAVIATMPSSVEPLRKLVRDTAKRLDVDSSRVHVRSYRQLAWDDGHRWYAPNVHRFLDDLDVPHDPEQRHWIMRAYDQGLVP